MTLPNLAFSLESDLREYLLWNGSSRIHRRMVLTAWGISPTWQEDCAYSKLDSDILCKRTSHYPRVKGLQSKRKLLKKNLITSYFGYQSVVAESIVGIGGSKENSLVHILRVVANDKVIFMRSLYLPIIFTWGRHTCNLNKRPSSSTDVIARK